MLGGHTVAELYQSENLSISCTGPHHHRCLLCLLLAGKGPLDVLIYRHQVRIRVRIKKKKGVDQKQDGEGYRIELCALCAFELACSEAVFRGTLISDIRWRGRSSSFRDSSFLDAGRSRLSLQRIPQYNAFSKKGISIKVKS